ncbi:cobalamin B12-binding domain-containing protein [Desulfobacula sp.]
MIEESILKQAQQTIIGQDKAKAIELTKSIIDQGHDAMMLMTEGFIPGINQVGDLFGRGTLFLPELIQAAGVMKEVTDIINASVATSSGIIKKSSKIIMATVKGDVHDIGKCIVVSLLQANGFEILDLGRDVDTDEIIKQAIDNSVDVIGTSALLTTTMGRQKDVEDALKSAGYKDKIKTIIGGAPVTGRWAAKIGCDAYAEDAQDAVVKIKELLG